MCLTVDYHKFVRFYAEVTKDYHGNFIIHVVILFNFIRTYYYKDTEITSTHSTDVKRFL